MLKMPEPGCLTWLGFKAIISSQLSGTVSGVNSERLFGMEARLPRQRQPAAEASLSISPKGFVDHLDKVAAGMEKLEPNGWRPDIITDYSDFPQAATNLFRKRFVAAWGKSL